MRSKRSRALILVVAITVALGVLAAPGPASADPSANFSVEAPFWMWSHGEGWVEGRTVTMVIDSDEDPGNGILYTDTTTVERWGSEPSEVGWEFELEELFEIEPGHFVSVDDGVEIVRTLWVEDLEITDIDEDLDTIEGTAAPLARVDVSAGGEDYEAYRTVEADGSGLWLADFSVPGDEAHEGEVFDIEIDTGGAAQIYDADGDSTHREWYLEEPPTPNVFVRPDGDEMWGADWFGGDVTITIDADDDPAEVLFETVIETDDGEFEVWIGDELDILPGHFVVVTDGESTKSHWVTDLTITEVDAEGDLVHGIAEPGSEVFVGSSFAAMIWEHLNFQFGPENRNPDSLNEYLGFRQAVAHAIDRDLLVAEVPGAGYAIDSYVDAYVPELSHHAWSQYPYDPAAAAALVDDLCTDLGRDCAANPPVAILTTSDSEARLALADLLVPMLAAAGIELQIDLESSEEFFFGGTFENGTFDVGEWAWVGARDLSQLVQIHWVFDPEERFDFNPYNWGTPDSSIINAGTARMAELIGLMDANDDRALLESYVAEAEQILADQAVIIPLYVREESFEMEGPFRIVTADGSGNWTADFSVPWEDQDPLDIGPGVGGYAEQEDDDGDATHAGWSGDEAANEPPEGTVEPTTQSVFYGDSIAPFVISVTDVDSPHVDALTDPPPGLELLGAPCSGVESVECTLTIEGMAMLPAGEHTLTVVLDDGEDTSAVTMTVHVRSEYEELQDIRSELADLIDSGAFGGWGWLRAAVALETIDRAAQPRNWDEDQQPSRSWVFAMLRAAVHQLTSIRADHTTQPEAVDDLVDRIVDLTRRCATYAIDEAAQAGVSPWWIAWARAELEEGDDRRAAGQASKAVSNYRNAWRFAQTSMR